jgi:phage gp36-like protein
MYVTPAQLIDGPDSAQELAQLFGVATDLLRAVVAGQDVSAWPPAEVAIAQDALASIEQRIAHADGEVNARLAKRGYTLPLDPLQFPVLTVWARSIARYHLHPHRDRTSTETGRLERDHTDAIRALDFVAVGKLSLGAGDPLAVDAAASGVQVSGRTRLFTRDTLGAL